MSLDKPLTAEPGPGPGPSADGASKDDGRAGGDNDGLTVRNEFASVRLRVRDPGGRPRLRIEDLRTQRAVELDAVELESLAWASHADLATLLDPGASRWPRTAHRDSED